ncbi:response regulator transcription factor [Aestuariicoccus sp. MJ-SS9]|uniref:response regulator transcription factor n=1 Tax=Aestuariicoccus sp. MJ-SS9 TaxID=3079855 RepID=UPI0029135B23|nr:response regulator transcription factor [Aestuariicoccus sp. MJ-SS9]MDU8909764.1 response regulator transcription factor [Aestuariicoccus sp. MJ-SS9]
MRIAIIEDNESVAKGIAYRLQDRGHATDLIADGHAAEEFLETDENDIIILDINLPGRDGLSILRRMRARGDHRPVLLLTARSATNDLVAGLDAGADDYLAKPFEMDELEARIRALSRRVPNAMQTEITMGRLRYVPDQRLVMIDGAPLELPRRELSLLDALLRARSGAKSKTELIETLYGTGADVAESAVEAHISRLRKKLGPVGLEIRALRNIGYVLQERQG